MMFDHIQVGCVFKDAWNDDRIIIVLARYKNSWVITYCPERSFKPIAQEHICKALCQDLVPV